ncbi:MAG: hypothetical protein ABI325_09705 [Ginsengibacter sp.]
MKYILVLVIICSSFQSHAQKYILLDKAISQPAFYSNKILVSAKYKGFVPLEKKDIPKFLEALEEIAKRLSSGKITGKAKSYKFGCTELNGVAFPLASGERLDYVLTSSCENLNITMHLCDAKLSNEDNAYYIKTWIKYIRSAQKQNQRQ